jgi:hypothetical protein
MPIAIKQCWQCSHFIKHSGKNIGSCEEAAAYAREDGYPLQREGALVAKDANASNCQDFDLTVENLREMHRMGYAVPYASFELFAALDALEGDPAPEPDPNNGIVRLPANPHRWGQTCGRGW